MGFPTASASGNFTVNPGSAVAGSLDTKLRCAAWWALSLAPARAFPELIGENVPLPGVDGTSAYPLAPGEVTFTLELRVLGECDRSGGTISNVQTGIDTNLNDLWTNVGKPPTTAGRSAQLIKPDASTTTPVVAQFRMAIVGRRPSFAIVLIDVTIPTGRML